MIPAEWGLLFGIIAHSVAVIMALVKLVAWVTEHITTSEQRIKSLEYQVNNDVTGRRVVGEMREDLATIKAQVNDMRQDIHHLRKKVDQ
jgi:predicted  nucleic acid-binding Zn-ribbon protein